MMWSQWAAGAGFTLGLLGLVSVCLIERAHTVWLTVAASVDLACMYMFFIVTLTHETKRARWVWVPLCLTPAIWFTLLCFRGDSLFGAHMLAFGVLALACGLFRVWNKTPIRVVPYLEVPAPVL